jgi:flagellar basal-body rod protein FlgB
MIGKTAQIELLARLVDAAHLRHAVIAHNLANVNTPNYHRLEVRFESELSEAMAGIGEPSQPKIVEAADTPARQDGNNVDLDVELGLMNRNSLLAAAATQILAMQLSQLRSAITGR